MDDHANGNLKAEVTQAVQEHPDLTYAQIAELLGVKPHQVAIWANQGGIFRRRKFASESTQGGSLDNRIRELERQLAEARRLKALRNRRISLPQRRGDIPLF